VTAEAETPLWFEVLGPLRARRGGQEVSLGAPKQRAVLAVLLVGRNRLVSRDAIIEAVWGEAPPARAVNVVQTYVAGLRRELEPARARRAPADLLTSTGDGYLLRLSPDSVDLDAVERRVATAARLHAGGDFAGAAAELDAALALWRGEPLAGVPGMFAEIERGRLVERRVAVLEDRAEIGLALGKGAELVDMVSRLVGEHPLRERPRGLLMRALCQVGRQAEALAVFRDVRRTLIEELGVEPGPELQRLHQAVLGRKEMPPERAAAQATLAEPVRPAAPAELPHTPVAFLGRDAELARLDQVLAAHHGATGPVVAITGPAGVGKTALAVHWAHRVRGSFPDGQLYVDLHGYHAERDPLGASEVLRRLLRSLGVPAAEVPGAPEERSALFRTMLADRRVLVVLDNARGSAELLPLLPGSRSGVLVTSRRRLDGLVAQADAHLVELAPLGLEAAVRVFARVAGEHRVREEPDAVRRLVRRCDRLPLAVRIAAARLAAHPELPVAELVAELDDEHGRLAALGLEDGESTVRAAFDASRRALPPLAARLLALLGVHRGPDVTPQLAAALAAVDPANARRALDALAAAHLLARAEPGRYAPHDLVRSYTRGLADALPAEERAAATTRALDYHLHCADRADALLPISRGDVRVAVTYPPPAVPTLAGSEDAMSWLDAELANLLAAVDHAAEAGWFVHAWQLPYTLSRFFWLRTDRENWLRTHRLALRAAGQLGDPDAQFVTLHNLGVVLLQYRRFDEALAVQRQALQVCRAQGDTNREARALTTIGNTLQDLGRAEEAERHYREAVRVGEASRAVWAQANAWHNLGLLYLGSGHHRDAVRWLSTALRMYREVDELCGTAATLTDLADARLGLDAVEEALDSARQALEVAVRPTSPYHQALAHDRIGRALELRDDAGACSHWQRALALLTDLGAPEADEVRQLLAKSRAPR
jgi:DNA-binding SARP family transcriptional activator/tetratricopeptide (TPR) repeat protein